MEKIATISNEKLELMDKYYTKEIDCPWKDDSECTGKAIVFLNGHAYQGIIECDACGSDSCPHNDTHTEEVEVTFYYTPDIDGSYDATMEVCDLCDCEVE